MLRECKQQWIQSSPRQKGLKLTNFFSEEELRQIKNPVLMLIGDQDRLNPPKALEQARKQILQIETEIIPNAGLMLVIEQPELVDARILRFLVMEKIGENHYVRKNFSRKLA